MKYTNFLFIVTFFMLFSCMDDGRHKVIGDQLTVYFFDAKDESLATDLAKYWKDNQFITGKKQDLQIAQRDGSFIVSIIASQPKEIGEMTFNERLLLIDLEKDLQKSVFKGKNTELEICNAKFERIYEVD